MATTTLHDYLKDLHFQGAINLDTPLRALVSAETLQIAPAAAASTYPPTDIFIGRRYIYVTLTAGNPQLAAVAGVAEHVRAATGQQGEVRPSQEPPESTRGLTEQFDLLHTSGLINLDVPLRSLVQPDGGGAVILREDIPPSIFIHQAFVFIHVGGNPTLIEDVANVASDVRAETT
jgi:hypothetical protein